MFTARIAYSADFFLSQVPRIKRYLLHILNVTMANGHPTFLPDMQLTRLLLMLTTALKTKTMKVMKLKLLNPMLPTPPLEQDLFRILWSPSSSCPKSWSSL